MNTCPVFRRSGGYSYGWSVPGPIGSILAPARDPRGHASLPFASSLCGSCSDVCPVRIDLHEEIYEWRQELGRLGLLPAPKRILLKAATWMMRSPALFRFVGALGRWLVARLPRSLLYMRFNVWGRQRELPVPPKKSFREMYRSRRGRA